MFPRWQSSLLTTMHGSSTYCRHHVAVLTKQFTDNNAWIITLLQFTDTINTDKASTFRPQNTKQFPVLDLNSGIGNVSQCLNTQSTFPAILSMNVPCDKLTHLLGACMQTIVSRDLFHVLNLCCENTKQSSVLLRCFTPTSLLLSPTVSVQLNHTVIPLWETDTDRKERRGREREEMSGEVRVIRQRVCLCVYVLNCSQLTVSTNPEAMAISLSASQVAALLSALWLVPSGLSQGLSALLV